MDKGKFRDVNRRALASVMSVGMLFSAACSDKDNKAQVSETQASGTVSSEETAVTENVSDKPSYDPVPIDYESEYLGLTDSGFVSSYYEAETETIDLFKDFDRRPVCLWQYYNGHIFVYGEKIHYNVNYHQYSLIDGVDSDPAIYEFDMEGNLISSLRMVDFWAANFPSSNMHNRSAFTEMKNLYVSVQPGGFVIGCDNQYCMYSFKTGSARKIVTDHGPNPGSYAYNKDGYFDGETFLTLTLDDENWYLEIFDMSGNHKTEQVSDEGLNFGASGLWFKTAEDKVAVSYQKEYILRHLTVDLNDFSWSLEDGNLFEIIYNEPVDGYYEKTWDNRYGLYDAEDRKVLDLGELRSLIKGHEEAGGYLPQYIGCNDEGLLFLNVDEKGTAELATLKKTDKPYGKEVITMLVPDFSNLWLPANGYLEAAVIRFNNESDKYYCKLMYLNEGTPETLAVEYATAFASDCAPDIVISPAHYMLLDNEDLCADMSAFVEQHLGENAMKSVIDGCRDDKTDKQFCLPLNYTIEFLSGEPSYCDDSYDSYLAMLKETSYDPIWANFHIRYSEYEPSTEAYLRCLIADQLDLYFQKGYFDADCKAFYEMADFMIHNNYQMVTNKVLDQGAYYCESLDYMDVYDLYGFNGETMIPDYSRSDLNHIVGIPSSDGRGSIIQPDCCINVNAGSAEKEGVIEFLDSMFNKGRDADHLALPVCPSVGDPGEELDKSLSKMTIQPASDTMITDIIIEETMTYLDDIDDSVNIEDVAKRINDRVGGYLAAYAPER